MPFRFRPNLSVINNVRRVAGEQLEGAIAAARDPNQDRKAAVHEGRKATKKIRALLRLVRGAMPSFAAENAAFREAARRLAIARDADVITATFDSARHLLSAQLSSEKLAVIRAALAKSSCAVADDGGSAVDVDQCLAEFAATMENAQVRVRCWQLDADEASTARARAGECLVAGFTSAYRKARRQLSKLKQADKDHRLAHTQITREFHELRKQVKTHWYHLRLLQGLAGKRFRKRARAIGKLGEMLGDDHDIAVLVARIDAVSADIIPSEERNQVIEVFGNGSRNLRLNVMNAATGLFREQPKAAQARCRTIWKNS